MINRSYIQGHEGHPHYYKDGEVKDLKMSFSKKDNKDLVNLFKNLSDPTKLNIYLLLQRVEELPVTDIVEIVGASQSSVSHALSDLKKIKLVKSQRCGKLICYSLRKNKHTENNLLKRIFEKFRV